nr:hypothetical protein [Tanacetum cinerariifolium]
KEVSDQHHIVLPLWSSISSTYKSSDDKAEDDKSKDDTGSKTVVEPVNKEDQAYRDELDRLMSQEIKAINAASTSGTFSTGGPSSPHPDAFIPDDTLFYVDQDDSQIPDLEDTAELRKAEFNNMESSTVISPIPTHRVHIDHPKEQTLGDPQSVVQTRGMAKKSSRAHAFVSYIHKQRRTNHKDYKNGLFSCFLSQIEPKNIAQALDDESWVEASCCNLAYKRNKKDKMDIVVKNKVRLVTQGHKKEEYDEVFAPMARIKAIWIVLAFVSFMGFIVYQMDDEFQGGACFLLRTAASTPIETHKPLVKDDKASDVDVHLYRSMIGSLMYLTASKPDIMFTVTCSRFQGEGSGSGLGCQETMGGAIAQIRPEGTPIQSSDPPFSTGNTVGSEDDRMEHAIELKDPVPQTPYDSPLSGGHIHGSDRAGTSRRHNLGRMSVSKHGRKNLKSQQKFQDIDDLVDEGSGEKRGSTTETVSTTRPYISAARQEVSTSEPKCDIC